MTELPRSEAFARDRKYWWGKASWTDVSYKTKRVLCDECVMVLHENHRQGGGPHPMPARRRRRTPQSDLRLCYRHAFAWGDEERNHEC